MPDWFYRTVSRPLLFRLPAEKAQALACGFMGMIGNLPAGLGGTFIDFLGHMRPDVQLEKTVLGRKFIGPVGLGIVWTVRQWQPMPGHVSVSLSWSSE